VPPGRDERRRTPSPLSPAVRRRHRYEIRALRPCPADHDGGYHLLFSFPRMIEDLLTGFVDAP